MAAPFDLDGDPVAIRASAARWGGFAGKAAGASGRISRMDASEFVGSEGDQYRHALNSDMRPHLEVTATAWGAVHGALNTYADSLERLQARMATVAATAGSQRTRLDHAQSALADSRTADLRHLNPADTTTTTTPDTYRSHTAERSGAVTDAQHALQGSIDAANKIHAEHETALTLCCRRIDAAKALRFVKPPGWLSRTMHAVSHWVKENAGQLMQISAILKTISGIAGILALIPVLAPVMGPIAFVTGAAAFAIDLAVSAATGKWDWKQLVLDGVSLIPGSRALMQVRTLQRLGSVGKAAETMAKSEKLWKVADGIEQGTNVAVSGYDLGMKIKDGKAGWEDYVGAATTVAGTKFAAPRAIRQRLHLGSRSLRKFNAIKDVVVSTADAATSGYDLAVKIKDGKAGLNDFVDTASKMAKVGSNTATVTKYRAPGATGDYHPGTQMHHRSWEQPEYTGADSAKAFKNGFHRARTAAGLHLAATALTLSLHAGPRVP